MNFPAPATPVTPSEPLFSYGTLQLEPVQMATFGRRLQGTADTVTGYRMSVLEIEDPHVVALSGKAQHPIIQFTGVASDTVSGTVLLVTPEELRNADTYEVSAYKRVWAPLGSGGKAWAYVDARETSAAG